MASYVAVRLATIMWAFIADVNIFFLQETRLDASACSPHISATIERRIVCVSATKERKITKKQDSAPKCGKKDPTGIGSPCRL